MTTATATLTGLVGRVKSWKDSLEILKGNNLIWWLVNFWDGGLKQFIAFVLFYLLFRAFSFTASMAIVMVISMYLHEVAHGWIFRYSEIEHKVLFLFPLGAVAAPANAEENKRSDLLVWWRLALLLMAGPAMNVLLMFLGKALLLHGDLGTGLTMYAHDIVSMNALLFFMNMIPVWKLDAGQFFKLIYSSLREHHDRLFSVAFTLVTIVMITITFVQVPVFDLTNVVGTLIKNFGWMALTIVFTVSIWHTQSKDDPKMAESALRLTTPQIVACLLGFFTLCATALMLL
ncbi:MAG: M50 family metallopeptidase [bacterium]|nr:M50 family metallopeptidase [bacterium]